MKYVIGLAVFLILGASAFYYKTYEDFGVVPEDVDTVAEKKVRGPSIEVPAYDAVVANPVEVRGTAPGFWFFEASLPVSIEDSSGTVLVAVPFSAEGEWMTEGDVPFSGSISVPGSYKGPAFLVIARDNPSGLPENDASIKIPITIE